MQKVASSGARQRNDALGRFILEILEGLLQDWQDYQAVFE